jgi:LmbE family N-acetylglucosaminyl deacetylase
MARSKELTLMAVHAHPDDESSSTGGVLARYSDETIRTVLVTCTNAEYGDGPGASNQARKGVTPDQVAKTRLAELAVACEHLRIGHLETLRYHDSRMHDWDFKDRPDVFCMSRSANRWGASLRFSNGTVLMSS